MAVRLEILDQYARQVGTINGQTVSGPLRAYKGLRYIPRGGIIDQGETCSFDLPMPFRANQVLVPGTAVRVVDARFAGAMGTYYVDEKSESVSDDGHWATFTLAGMIEELRWETVPGFVALDNEATLTTIQRLLAIPTDTPWTPTFVNGVDTFTGVSFVAEDVTVQQAADKIIRDRLFHWRRGDGRIIEYGTFKRKTGIRLVRASQRPGAMNVPTIRPIPPGGIRNIADAASVANCLVLKGAGDGWAQLTLQPLYNATGEVAVAGTNWYRSGPITAFPGYNGAYPIYRRRRLDGGGLDGWQYFITDPTSVTAYRRRWLPVQRSDIGPVDNANPTDMADAAQWLYAIGVVYLANFGTVHNAIAVTSDGRGDNRGTAGDTVKVEYPVVSRGVRTLNVDGDWVAVSVESAVDDTTGAITDTWTLSDIGRAIMDDTATITGILEDIQQIKTGPMLYPVERDIHRDQPINAQNPVVITLNFHAGVQQIVQALFSIQLLPVYSTMIGGTVENHAHDVTIPALTVDASVPYTDETAYNPGGQFVHGHTAASAQGSGYQPSTASTSLSHGHTDSIGATKSGSVTGANVADIQTGQIKDHHHSMTITAGGPVNSDAGKATGLLFTNSTGGPYGGAFLQGNQWGGTLNTSPPQTYTATGNHGHQDTIGVTNSGGVNSGGPGSAQVSSPYGGFAPSVPAPNSGWQPGSVFPGYANAVTRPATVPTTTYKAPAFSPLYGIYADTGKPTQVAFYINGGIVAGPFNANTTGIDLAPYLKGVHAPVTISIISATLGRVIVDGVIRATVSTYAVT